MSMLRPATSSASPTGNKMRTNNFIIAALLVGIVAAGLGTAQYYPNGSGGGGTIATATGTTGTLTSAVVSNFVCTGACTITVPVPAAGAQYCVYNDNNLSSIITLSAIGSSARYENTARTAYGTAGTGTLVSGGSVGDRVCIVYRDSTHYSTIAYVGSWTAN